MTLSADSLARKVAQQRLEIESFDAQVGGPSVVDLQTAIDIAEEYESALAPMREALQAMTDAMNRMLLSQRIKEVEVGKLANRMPRMGLVAC